MRVCFVHMEGLGLGLGLGLSISDKCFSSIIPFFEL